MSSLDIKSVPLFDIVRAIRVVNADYELVFGDEDVMKDT